MDVVPYFDIILHPEETMKKDVKQSEMNAAMKSFALAGAILGLLIGLAVAFGGAVAGLGGLSFAAIIIVPILVAILMVMGSGIGYGLYFLVAQLLGGKGTFLRNYYLGSRLLWPTLFASVIVGIVALIPLLGALIQLVWGLYTIYLTIVLISIANNMTKLRALVVYVIPTLLLLIILMTVIGGVVLGALASAGAGGMIR